MDRQGMIDAIRYSIYIHTYDKGIPISIDLIIRQSEYYYPISIARVLSALGEDFIYYKGDICNVDLAGTINGVDCVVTKMRSKCKRKLLTDSGSDAILDYQSDDTIKAIHDLLLDK